MLWEGHASYIEHGAGGPIAHKLMVYASSMFRYGHEAVLFFFVLSGFVIHLRYARRLALDGVKSRFDWFSYVYRRARRLYPPLLFALLLTSVLDHIGKRHGFLIYVHQTPVDIINRMFNPHYGWRNALGNLLFLVETYVPAWGTDTPLWSLKFEWWFYMLYPLAWWLSRRSIALATVAVALGLFLSFHPALLGMRLLSDVLRMMLIWWMGALLADVYVGRLPISFSSIAPVSLLLPIAVACRQYHQLSDHLWGLSFSGLIALGFTLQQRGFDLNFLKRLKPLGGMSYTLYVTHVPILVLLSGWVMSRTATPQLPHHFGWVFIGVVLSTAFAWPMHFLLEKPFTGGRTHAPGVPPRDQESERRNPQLL